MTNILPAAHLLGGGSRSVPPSPSPHRSTHWAPLEPEQLVRGVLAPPEGAADNCLELGMLWGDSEQDLALAAWFTAFTVSKTRR